jgi:hypothetical protein
MKLKRLSSAAAMVALLAVLSPANAKAQPPPPPDNWGQEVKSCNQTNCYPGGTSRGGYVNGQAKDDDAPGYGKEIQDLANGTGPGKADPSPFPQP